MTDVTYTFTPDAVSAVASTHANRMATIRKISALASQISTIAANAYSTALSAKSNSSLSTAELVQMCSGMLGNITGTALDPASFMIQVIDELVTLAGTTLKGQLKAISDDFT